jgi:hypothetical protein
MFEFCRSCRLTKNKSFEIQIDLFDGNLADSWFEFNLKWTSKRDHAGPSFTLILLKLIYFDVRIYDNRHWNYETDDWEVYDEDNKSV